MALRHALVIIPCLLVRLLILWHVAHLNLMALAERRPGIIDQSSYILLNQAFPTPVYQWTTSTVGGLLIILPSRTQERWAGATSCTGGSTLKHKFIFQALKKNWGLSLGLLQASPPPSLISTTTRISSWFTSVAADVSVLASRSTGAESSIHLT
jgi:hypothetical protein